jgi:flagellar basal body P-ring formation protein FlgA
MIPKNRHRFSEKIMRKRKSKTMTRVALSVLILALGAAAAAAQTNARLRSAVTVAGDVVRIGDLVENAGLAANTPIFRAPDLGQTGAVPARAVVEAVRPYGLIAVDTRGLSEVSVTHASHTIVASEIERRIASELTARYNLGKAENLKVTFDRDLRPMEVALTAGAEPSVSRVAYDVTAKRFDLSFDLVGSSRQTWRYTGSAIETVEAVVSTRVLNRGDVIRQGDIAIERRPKGEFTSEPPAPSSEVVGLALRRSFRAGQPLRSTDLMKPEIVKKNDMVMMRYEVPGIVLTLRGQSLDNGTEGDVVNVMNVQSKRTIQGIVTSPGQVKMLSPSAARLAAAETK